VKTLEAKVFSGEELEALAQEIGVGGRNLLRFQDSKYYIDFVVKDHSKKASELHEVEDDIYVILEGQGRLFLGGQIVGRRPRGDVPGHYVGDDLIGATEQVLGKGDLVVIPHGVPHMVDASESRIVYLVIKEIV
jgi:mannose-6-phosphate isomerase-like protein (cupin superfamily)